MTVSWWDRAMQAERELAAVREEVAALRTETDTLRREHTIITKDLAAARETRDRYERALKAISKWATQACEFDATGPLSKDDVLEWVAMTADALLDGQEAECPVCSTHVHEGACVGEEDDDGPL